MALYIKSVKATALHGRFDLECEFTDGVNIIYGENGTGKTTLLHILANVLNADYERFFYLQFKEIDVRLSDGQAINVQLKRRTVGTHEHLCVEANGIKVTKEFCSRRQLHGRTTSERSRLRAVDGDVSQNIPTVPLSVAYFPAFRTAIDAWAANKSEVRQRTAPREGQSLEKTDFARVLFGNFVPRLDYPATSEIESTLNEQIRAAITTVSRADRQYFGEVPAGILEMLSSSEVSDRDPREILGEISSLAKRFQEYPIHVESTLTELHESVKAVPKNEENRRVAVAVLTVYKKALERIVRIQERSFAKIEQYVFSVNSFLKHKSVSIASSGGPYRGVPFVKIEFGGTRPAEAKLHGALSSGERQIVTLIYASTQMSHQEVILVDEPEISLHVDWQRRLLPAMIEQMPSKQLIVCTHSPIIGSKYRDRMRELEPKLTEYSEDTPDVIDLFGTDVEEL